MRSNVAAIGTIKAVTFGVGRHKMATSLNYGPKANFLD